MRVLEIAMETYPPLLTAKSHLPGSAEPPMFSSETARATSRLVVGVMTQVGRTDSS